MTKGHARLKELRKQKKKSQLDLALDMGYENANVVSRLESGKLKFSEGLARTFAREFGVSFEEFTNEEAVV